MAKPPLFVRLAVRKRAGNCCEMCGVKIRRNKKGFHNGSFHHRKPKRMGVIDTVSNLVLICLDCHRQIHQDEFAAGLQGWMVWHDPEMTPVRWRCGGWALLVPDGSLEYLTHREGERLCEYVNGGESAIYSWDGLALVG